MKKVYLYNNGDGEAFEYDMGMGYQDYKEIKEDIIIQLFSAFHLDIDNAENKVPIFLTILLSKFCELDLVKKKRLKCIARQYGIDFLIKFRMINENSHWEKFLENWYENKELIKQCEQQQVNAIEQLKGIDFSFLNEVIIKSDFFRYAILSYIQCENHEDDSYVFFSTFQNFEKKTSTNVFNSLEDECNKIRILVKFIEKYYLSKNIKLNKDLPEKTRKFVKDYICVDLDDMLMSRKQLCTELIFNNIICRNIFEKYKENTNNLEIAHIFYLFYCYHTVCKKEIDYIRLFRYTLELYKNNKECLILTIEEKELLNELIKSNLPYSEEIVNYERIEEYILDKSSSLTKEDIFDEFEYYALNDDKGVYEYNDLLELCSANLYCLIKNQIYLRKCNLCNRFFLSKQNSSKKENYCKRINVVNGLTTCSKYNSQKPTKKGSNKFLEIDKMIINLRSKLSTDRSNCENNPNNTVKTECLNRLIDSLPTIRKQAKKIDADQSSNIEEKFNEITSILSNIEKIREKIKNGYNANKIPVFNFADYLSIKKILLDNYNYLINEPKEMVM